MLLNEDQDRIRAQAARMELTLIWQELELLMHDALVFPMQRQDAGPWRVLPVKARANVERKLSLQAHNALVAARNGAKVTERRHVPKAKDIVIACLQSYSRVGLA